MSVYFIRNCVTGNIKIGFTNAGTFSDRLDDLQEATDCRLECLAFLSWGTRRTERRLHAYFNEDRVRGEWFAPTPQLEALARSVAEGRVRNPADLPSGGVELGSSVARAIQAQAYFGASPKVLSRQSGLPLEAVLRAIEEREYRDMGADRR